MQILMASLTLRVEGKGGMTWTVPPTWTVAKKDWLIWMVSPMLTSGILTKAA